MDKLQKTVEKMQKRRVATERDCTFAKLTTLGCGGTVNVALYPSSVKQLIFILRYLLRHKVPHCILGHGSNVLASDNYYNGVVVVTSRVREICVEGQTVVASCGVSTSKLCSELVRNGLTGGEFFGCLPATVGGAVVCNAGCFGQSAQQVVKSVVVLYKGRLRRLTNKQCNFQKRSSLFKNNADYVVLQVAMMFPKASPVQIQATVADMRKRKAQTQPLGCRSAGCVLYSDKTAVSRLIDQAGLKGFRLGGAQVSEKHAGFVINLDKATSRDIYLLIEYVKNTVHEKFGVLPKTELCLINFATPIEANSQPSVGGKYKA